MGGLPRKSMKIPKKVKVGPHIYQIKMVTNMNYEHGSMGITAIDKTTISIDSNSSLTQQEDTLIHEILHTIQHQVNFLDTRDHEIEEKGVARLTPLLLQVIRDNPKIFK